MSNPSPIAAPAANDPPRRRRFSPAGRRSFLILAACFIAIFLVGMVVQIHYVRELSRRIVGDGLHVESYGYDLSNLIGERDLLIASGLPKNGQPAMVDPPVLTEAQLAEVNSNEFRRAVVGNDMVIGVAVNGEKRAYPIRFLNWHEIANDTLGGVPIAVTFNPVCRSAVVFDRRVGGETVTFAYSGLLYNHNLLMYDVRPEPPAAETDARANPELASRGESLWSQLKLEAIAGPHAGQRLTVLPCRLMRFAQWQKLHPDTTVINGLDRFRKRYKRSPYQDVFEGGRPQYPVAPLPPADSEGPASRLQLGDLIAAFPAGDGWSVLPQPLIHTDRLPPDAPVVYARWFAWYAMHPHDSTVLDVPVPEASE